MQYRQFGKTGVSLSGLGFGMNRFSIHSMEEPGFEDAVKVVCHAIKQGINYIDVAKNYSNQMAFPILREAINRVPSTIKVHLCVKMMLYHTDKTQQGAVRSIQEQLKLLGCSSATFCFAQAVKSYEEYQQIIQPGGLYDGFVEAKEKGLIRHICFSSHASVEDTIKIMEEGRFEGITISYHPLNCVQMKPVLEKAEELGMGVLTMNSLAGGLIPQNPQLFQENNAEEVCKKSIQMIYGQDAVTCVLSGMQTIAEVDCNIQAIENAAKNVSELRNVFQQNGLCTGCDYCKGCPVGIPIRDFMYSANAWKFNNQLYEKQYGRVDEKLLGSIRMTQELLHSKVAEHKERLKDCVGCKACERKCTQSLPIVERLKQISFFLEQSIWNSAILQERIKEWGLFQYSAVALYPNCASTRSLVDALKEAFSVIPFRIFVIDRNELLWGNTEIAGVPVTVGGLQMLEKEKAGCIILTHYTLSSVLEQNVQCQKEKGVRIEKLYQEEDIPLVYLGG